MNAHQLIAVDSMGSVSLYTLDFNDFITQQAENESDTSEWDRSGDNLNTLSSTDREQDSDNDSSTDDDDTETDSQLKLKVSFQPSGQPFITDCWGDKVLNSQLKLKLLFATGQHGLCKPRATCYIPSINQLLVASDSKVQLFSLSDDMKLPSGDPNSNNNMCWIWSQLLGQ
jgi:hypothetical protein